MPDRIALLLLAFRVVVALFIAVWIGGATAKLTLVADNCTGYHHTTPYQTAPETFYQEACAR